MASEYRAESGRLELRGLTKAYGGQIVVKDVTVSVEPGEFFTLLGPSGSGKTTTLMIIAGFTPADSGDVSIDGRSLGSVSADRRNIGTVFQHYALFPHMSVAENLAFPLEMRRLPRSEINRRICELLEIVRLQGMEEKYPSQLSGGQQQRVALARAVIFRPPVLLMDEPLGALDKKLRAHLQLELKQIQRQIGVTVVYVTHDQEEALTMSDRIAIMHDGQIVQVGTPTDLYASPRSVFVADFLGESNMLSATIGRALDGQSVARVAAGGQLGVQTELPPGRSCTLAIRPERFRLCHRHDEVGAIKGTVTDVVFSGDVIRIWVRADGFGRLLVKEQNRADRRPVHVGDLAELGWDLQDLLVFESGASAP
jgi:putative spermidine/putrescine transport system ATP-binding protein